MNSRDQTLSFILLGLIVFSAAGALGYFFVLQPYLKQQNAETALNTEIADLEQKVDDQKLTAKRLAQARVRSLPADKAMAQREYVVAMERVIEAAGMPKGYTISPKPVDNSPRAVPEIAKGKPIYTRVAYELVFKKADAKAVKDFLYGYYQLGLLHQITAIHIKKEDDPNAKGAKGSRNDLTVTLTTEAILVDGAENRKTLLPVPTAYAAIGGGAMYRGLILAPEIARGVRAQQLVPILSPVNRNYDLIVRKDPFNGPLIDVAPPTETPLKIAKISDVKIKPDEKHNPVKYSLSGKGANTATVTALAAGTLFAEGALKVDPKGYAIELPTTSASEGTETITVIATSADGTQTDKTTFKVSVEYHTPEVKPGEDISQFIILIGSTPRSDGTAWARVKDNANKLRYEIEAKPRGVTIIKEWSPAADRWRKDLDYDHPPGILAISDEVTKTNRFFKVIAVDSDGLIIADLRPDGSAPSKTPGKGGQPGKGPAAPSKGAKQGSASPLAALGGNRIVAVSKPRYYRWPVGQPLAKIQELNEDEAKKILKVADASGPVFDVTAILR